MAQVDLILIPITATKALLFCWHGGWSAAILGKLKLPPRGK